MIFVQEDVRPPTLLRSTPAHPANVAGGTLVMLLIHVGVPALIWLWWKAGGGGDSTRPLPLADQVVEARFVQLGKPFDPTKLPNRLVPRLETAPVDSVAVAEEPRDNPPPVDAGAPPPPESMEDMVRRLGDRAKAFAEIAEAQDREGDPQGIAEGTATEARAGDLYRGQLYSFFRRNWMVPTVLSDEDRNRLVAEVHVQIDGEMHVDGFRLAKPSGNALFDESISEMLAAMQRDRVQLPPPPLDAASLFVGKTLALRFRGSDVR